MGVIWLLHSWFMFISSSTFWLKKNRISSATFWLKNSCICPSSAVPSSPSLHQSFFRCGEAVQSAISAAVAASVDLLIQGEERERRREREASRDFCERIWIEMGKKSTVDLHWIRSLIFFVSNGSYFRIVLVSMRVFCFADILFIISSGQPGLRFMSSVLRPKQSY